ncbi:hypothetical protein MSC49_27730 [Methylosinus sp. C49]|nr:hypothetical protein MSC49_27730 [Methylosinus sp. C49]
MDEIWPILRRPARGAGLLVQKIAAAHAQRKGARLSRAARPEVSEEEAESQYLRTSGPGGAISVGGGAINA